MEQFSGHHSKQRFWHLQAPTVLCTISKTVEMSLSNCNVNLNLNWKFSNSLKLAYQQLLSQWNGEPNGNAHSELVGNI